MVQAPTDTTVSDLSAAYMRINYTLAIPDGRTFPTTSELWIVPRGNYFFMIGAGTRQDGKTGSREEISKILLFNFLLSVLLEPIYVIKFINTENIECFLEQWITEMNMIKLN